MMTLMCRVQLRKSTGAEGFGCHTFSSPGGMIISVATTWLSYPSTTAFISEDEHSVPALSYPIHMGITS